MLQCLDVHTFIMPLFSTTSKHFASTKNTCTLLGDPPSSKMKASPTGLKRLNESKWEAVFLQLGCSLHSCTKPMVTTCLPPACRSPTAYTIVSHTTKQSCCHYSPLHFLRVLFTQKTKIFLLFSLFHLLYHRGKCCYWKYHKKIISPSKRNKRNVKRLQKQLLCDTWPCISH